MLTIAGLANCLSTAPMLAWSVGWQEILVIVVVVLILFGGRKIPELARGIGKGLREFKREMSGIKRDFEEAAEEAEREDSDQDAPRPRRRKKKRPVESDEFEGDESAEEAAAHEHSKSGSDVKQG